MEAALLHSGLLERRAISGQNHPGARVSRGRRDKPPGFPTTTCEPVSPATWSQKSFWAASLKVKMSLLRAVRPTSTTAPSGATNQRATVLPCHIPASGSDGPGGAPGVCRQ